MKDFFSALFLPKPRNNHKAHLLSTKFLVLIITLLLITPVISDQRLLIKSVIAEISNQDLLDLTNKQRAENGLPELKINSQLNQAAMRKAEHMIENDYWAHNSPDGTTPWIFIKDAGYDYVYAGENLARGFNNANDAVSAWMASPDHRANILSPNYEDVGYSVVAGDLNGEQTILIVQEFGSKNNQPVSIVEKPQNNRILGTNIIQGINFRGSVSFAVVSALIFGFVMLLILDLLFVRKNKIVRFSGHHLDHGIFLVAIFIVIGIFSMGAVL